MERKVLIVEDNEGVALLLRELCSEVGVLGVHVRGGSDALTQVAQWIQQGLGPPDLAIIDIVLAELDGFQVANGIRSVPGGEQVPLIVISGVYKRLPDAFEASVHPQFLAKPFDPSAIRHAISSVLLAADQAAGVERGRLVKSAASELFVQLCGRRATGLLELWTQDVRRRLWWQSGFVRFAASNVRTETAGGMQVLRGELPAASFDRAVALARQMKVPLHEALAATRVFPPEKLAEVLKLQTAEVALHALSMAGADWMFSQADTDKLPDTKKHPLTLVLEAARREISPMDARESLLRIGDTLVSRSALLERELFAVRSAWPGEALLTQVSGTVPLVDVIAKAREDDLPFALALVSCGLLTTSQRSAARSNPGATSLEDLDKGKQFGASERQARQLIFTEQERTASLDHYALLGVVPNSSVEEVRRAYLELARRYHTDSYAGLELGSARAVLGTLFHRVNEAVETLSDLKRREEYDLFLSRSAQGLPTDVAAVLKAEDLFKQAERLLKLNARGKANHALELLNEAVALNGAEVEFRVYQAYARFCVSGASMAAEARQAIGQALQAAPNLASAYVFLGLIAHEQGSDLEAMRQFERALELDPSNDRALQELRTIRRRAEKAARGKSIFGRLFGK
jgi:curved DNA-binding protein CbpA/CheY-like chemotaxis protein